MSRKTTAALIAALGINLALAGGALMLANMNKPPAYDPGEGLAAGYADLEQVVGKPIDAEQGDRAVALKPAQRGGNTRVTFTCGKDLGVAGRAVHEGTWDGIAGAVLYRPDTRELVAIEAVFDVRTLRADANGLTNTLLAGEKWFDYEDHPTATFTCDSVRPIKGSSGDKDAATPPPTHELSGTFTLNGISRPVAIPVTLAFAGQSLTLDASFTILRSDFKVAKRESSLAGTAGGIVSNVDDEVELAVRVTASPDPTAALAELAQLIETQQEQLRIAKAEREQLRGLARRIEMLEEATDKLASSGFSAPAAVDVSALPVGYTDHLPSYAGPVGFDMVLVPGDQAKGVTPFYMGKHEVTWAMIERWAYCGDIDANDAAALIRAGLRPSPVYGEPSEIIQLEDKQNPSMAMSYLTATSYCKWLSEQTGRRYRLPTIEEWRHALAAGGGVPDDIDASSWHAGNAPKDYISQHPRTSPVGSKRPNTLGIHDMLGGVAEWVTGTGTDRVVVGGSIFSKAGELTPDWRAIEDIEVWSATYPLIPKSRFWYSDFYVTGIRLVCEAPSVAANPPQVSE